MGNFPDDFLRESKQQILVLHKILFQCNSFVVFVKSKSPHHQMKKTESQPMSVSLTDSEEHVGTRAELFPQSASMTGDWRNSEPHVFPVLTTCSHSMAEFSSQIFRQAYMKRILLLCVGPAKDTWSTDLFLEVTSQLIQEGCLY